MFKLIEREDTLASRVTEQVEVLILERSLKPGTRLPAERELANQFGVSRTVIREAVRALVAKGMLEVRQGSGMVVSTPTAQNVAQSMSLLLRGTGDGLEMQKVMEVRRLLEVEIAGVAAERRTAKDLETMKKILDENEGVFLERERFVAWDIAFHSALAAATHNELFSILLDSIAATMKKVRELGFNVARTPERALKYHRLILEKVGAGDADGARRAMEEHMSEAERTLAEGMRKAKTTTRP